MTEQARRKENWGMIKAVINVFAAFFGAVLDTVCFIAQCFKHDDNICNSCAYRFCASNQHPTICDECKSGSNYKEVDK